jgi:hypothetical protein
MQAERDELVKKVFPKLRKLCEQRGVEWGEVDLRWGITDEQKAEGKVLPICLAEIDRCRPYFIGILGELYGWIPEQIPAGLDENQKWLTEHVNNSVTALEILYGVLNNPSMADRSFFYFRDPDYIKIIPEDQRNDYLEIPSQPEIALFGNDEAGKRAAERREKLLKLKQKIRTSIPPNRLHEKYSSPLEFGRLVYEDLYEVINQLFLEEEKIDPLDQEKREHELFAASRFGVYIRRQDYFDALDSHVSGNSPPLVILGDSGSGKSALLANWVKYYGKKVSRFSPDKEKNYLGNESDLLASGGNSNSTHLVIFHFIGATSTSTDWAAMVRRIMGEFKRNFDIRQEIPDKREELRTAFVNWLSLVGAKNRVILIIDALNQLEDKEGAQNLVWLPPVIPPNIRLIFSTLPGKSYGVLQKLGWPTLTVKPLNPEESRRLITNYLAIYRKTLASPHIDRILSAPQTANPLYLQTLLEELRLYGDHYTLSQRVDYYLDALTIDGIYKKILERYEHDFRCDENPNLVQDAFSYLWAARNGLSEPELLDLLRSGGNPLPRFYWSPLFLAAEKSLLNRNGLLGFFHDDFRKAVHDRYLMAEEKETDIHLRLAEYFRSREIDKRKVEELPWHYARMGLWQKLFSLFSDPSFFIEAWKNNKYDVKKYWTDIETYSSYRVIDAYQPVIEDPGQYVTSFIWLIADLLSDFGYLNEAFSLRTFLSTTFMQLGDDNNLQASLGNQALILQRWGRLDEAMALHKQEEQICQELGNKEGLQRSLGNQALILHRWGRLEDAMTHYKLQEQILRKLGNRDGLQKSLGNQALVLEVWGRLEQAMTHYKLQEQICQELGNKDSLSRSLGNQALILKAWGRLEQAMVLIKQQEQIFRDLGNKNEMSMCLGNQANILSIWGRLEEAMALHKQEEQICQELGNKAGMAVSFGNQALILKERGRLEEAMTLHKQEEQICQELGNKAGMAVSFGNQALILKERGRLEEAMTLHKQEEQICRELGNKEALKRSLGNQANILCTWGRLEEAMALHKQGEQICRELGNMEGLAISFANQATVFQKQNNINQALKLAMEASSIARERGYTLLDKQIQSLLQDIKKTKPVDKSINPRFQLREEREKFVCTVSKGSGGFAVASGSTIFLIWFKESWHKLDGSLEVASLIIRLEREGRLPKWLQEKEFINKILLGGFEVEVVNNCPGCLIVIYADNPKQSTDRNSFLNSVLQKERTDYRCRITDLTNIYDTLSGGLKSKKFSGSEIATLLNTNLFGTCPQCHRHISGKDLGDLWITNHMGLNNVVIVGSDSGLQRLSKGFCSNEGCSSKEIVLRWRP